MYPLVVVQRKYHERKEEELVALEREKNMLEEEVKRWKKHSNQVNFLVKEQLERRKQM